MKKIDETLNKSLEKFKFKRLNLKKISFQGLNLKKIKFKRLNLKNPGLQKKFVRHLGKVSLACLSVAFLSSAAAIDTNTTAAAVNLNNEAGKTVLDEALKISRSKPALSVAMTIICIACIPAAGAVASPAMCVACGILIAKLVG